MLKKNQEKNQKNQKNQLKSQEKIKNQKNLVRFYPLKGSFHLTSCSQYSEGSNEYILVTPQRKFKSANLVHDKRKNRFRELKHLGRRANFS